MASRSIAKIDVSKRWLLFWAVLAVAIAAFIYESFAYALTRDPQPGATLLNRQLWYYAHMAFAVPILLIAPLQFLASLRKARPEVHRWLGRAFLGFSILAGLMAVWLGATIQYEGSRIPLAMFGLVWIGFSGAAWVCARKRDFVNHRKFVIRSFAIGLAFVWLRALGEIDGPLLGFISDEEMRNVTRDYLSFLLPLLLVEAWLNWIPAVQLALRRR
jgi:hypothetical protein